MDAPLGLEGIKKTFGDITKFIRSDGTLSPDWVEEELAVVPIPFSMRLSWSPETLVNKIRCHKLLVGTIHGVFQEIQNTRLDLSIQTYGGCFAYRPQRGSNKLSTHAWGIALDLNPESNEMGTAGTMDSRIVKIFTEAGFTWGGTFGGTRRDAMHFQFCGGY